MLPDSMQGYAPTIRGIALTHARVTVRQNGYTVYSTFVAPGAFVLDDLYPTASSGDLEVTITEADGRQTRYMQAFSAVPTLLREGTWRYSATAGHYRNGYESLARGTQPKPLILQATMARGLANEFSAFGGFMAANMYQSVLGGIGKNMRDFGAVSVDLSSTRATDRATRIDRNGASYTGSALRFLYAKAFISWGTSLRVAGYRYSTGGYRGFEEAVQVRELMPASAHTSRRHELRVDLTQQLGGMGSLFASARQQSYWATSGADVLVQMGYSGNYRQFGYSAFYSSATGVNRASHRQLMLSVSIPLDSRHASAQYAVTGERNGRVSQQASIYGSAFGDNRLTYNLTASETSRQNASGSASASYLAPVGRVDFSQSQGQGYGQSTFGMAGGVVAHEGGVTLSQPLGETIALVRAPNARGVGFDSQPGVATDAAGNAVIANLSPYRVNRVAIRTADLGDTVEIGNAALDVIPTRGAVVLAKFETFVGFRLLMTLTGDNGVALPLGSKIENEVGREIGIVGPDGKAFITGAGNSGRLKVFWGHGEEDQCLVAYSLPDAVNPPPVRELEGQCGATGVPLASASLHSSKTKE